MNGSWLRSLSVRSAVLGALLLLLLGLLLTQGTWSCRQAQRAENEQTREGDPSKEEELPFDCSQVQVLPVTTEEASLNGKPQHWGLTRMTMVSNRDDFHGQLLHSAGSPLDDIQQRNRDVAISRSITLPHRQRRVCESLFFPRAFVDSITRMSQAATLQTRHGVPCYQHPWQMNVMPGCQYQLVVLAAEPTRYAYLEQFGTVLGNANMLFEEGSRDAHYQLSFVEIEGTVPLPSHPMAWTSTASLIWDDVDPERLSLLQQRAMLDWLHFGGQLIISGPDSLDRLRTSFLADYLPATAGSSAPLTADDQRLAEVNAHWSTLASQEEDPRPWQFTSETPLDAISLQLTEQGALVPLTGGLFAERLVGRGRVVVSAFALDDPLWTQWKHADVMFNGCLLRRAAREFQHSYNGRVIASWCNLRQEYLRDARLTCGLRYFTRDAIVEPSLVVTDSEGVDFQENWENPSTFSELLEPEITPETRRAEWEPTAHRALGGGYAADRLSGVAGWNDRSAPSNAAREILIEAAGSDTPARKHIFLLIAGYLVVLGPINWCFFRMWGRVELAWVAAPLLAIVGAVVVAKLERLDTGLARAQTEVSVLELHAGYQRGHLTRYVGYYSSLSTDFEFSLPDDNAVMLPFATEDFPGSQTRRQPVTLHRGEGVQLKGMHVISNSTEMVHCEQLFDCGGVVQLQQGAVPRLMNELPFALQGAGIVRRTAENKVEVAWLGRVLPGQAVAVDFRPSASPSRLNQSDPDASIQHAPLFSQRDESQQTTRHPPEGEVSLHRLVELAENPRRLQPGEMRLVAWTEASLGELEALPAASQIRSLTLVLVHLQQAPLGDPEMDVNTSDHPTDVFMGASPP